MRWKLYRPKLEIIGAPLHLVTYMTPMNWDGRNWDPPPNKNITSMKWFGGEWMDSELKIIFREWWKKKFLHSCVSVDPATIFLSHILPPPSAGISHFSPIFPQPHMSNISFSYKQGAHFIQGLMESHDIFSRYFSHSSWFVMKIAKTWPS